MKHEHKLWANHIISGKTPVDAALLVWTNIARKTAFNRAGILGKDSGIQNYIREQREKIANKTSETLADELSKGEVGILLDSIAKRQILAKIASGTYETEKLVMVNGSPKKIKIKPDFADIIRAIELDNRMSGDLFLPKENKASKADEVTRVVIVEDTTEPNANNGND